MPEFDATIHLDEDKETIMIKNLKPIPNEVYILNSDPVELERMQLINRWIELETERHKI